MCSPASNFLGVILVTRHSFGIYDLVEAMDNVESASAAGDSFPTTRVLTADGVISFVGCLMGNPFINAIYIGHPGWKAMGGRLGYSAATGAVMLVLCSLGILATITALVPVISILPILLYIGMLIGSQAFQETPAKHAPADHSGVGAADCLMGEVADHDNALGAAGTSAAKLGIATLTQNGVLYDGMSTLGGGATLVGIILRLNHRLHHRPEARQGRGVRRRRSTILTFFGLMHSDAIGFAHDARRWRRAICSSPWC